MMKIGDLRHRITIQQLQNTQDSFGQQVETWIDVCTVWASLSPISGREFFAAEMVNSDVSHRIRIRYKHGITSDMRVKFKDRYFNIISALNYQERNVELQLMCRELI